MPNKLYAIATKQQPTFYFQQVGHDGQPEITLNARQAFRYVNEAEPTLFIEKHSSFFGKSYQVVEIGDKY